MVGLIIGYIITGIVIGAVARLVLPGRQSIGMILTICLGIVGALVGGAVTRAILGDGHTIITFIVSIVAAAILVSLVAGGRSRSSAGRA